MGYLKELKSGNLGLIGDQNTRVNPFLPDEGFYKLDGFHLVESLSITKWSGFSKFNSTQLTEGGNAATFTGLFEIARSGQTRQQLATGLTGVYRYGTPTANAWNALSLTDAGGARTGAATNLYGGRMYNDVFYFGNGVDINLKYNGTSIYRMGITAPSAVATTSVGSTGITAVTGYTYKYTYYNSSLGHESNPSPVSASTGAFTNKTVTVTVTCTADAQVDKIRVYRTTDGGAVWLYVGVVDNVVGTGTTTFSDNFADTTLGVAVDETGNGVPPVFSMIEIWKGHTFMVSNNSSRVWFSKNGFPNAVDSNDFRDLNANDGNNATGLIQHFGSLAAFKENSIWNGYGESRTDFGFVQQVPDIGSVNNSSIVPVPGKNLLLFLHGSGKFYVYNGIVAEQTALGIESDLAGLNQARLSQVTGRPYKTKNLCIWTVPNAAGTQNDLAIWYDYVEDKWGTRDLTNCKGNVISIMKDSTNKERFYLGGYTGYVWEGDTGGTDDGSAISCTVIDRAHPRIGENQFPSQDEIKNFYELTVFFKPSTTTVTAYYAIDTPDASYTSIGTIDCSATSGQATLRFNALCRRIFFKFTESGSGTSLVLRGWIPKFKLLGRSH